MKLPDHTVIKHVTEPLEAFTDIETNNQYMIVDEDDEPLYRAAEEAGMIARNLLGSRRGTHLHIHDLDGERHCTIERPFYLVKSDATVYNDTPLCHIRHDAWFATKQFSIQDNHVTRLRAVSNLPHKWTYELLRDGYKVGEVRKRWSGVGKELFTDADTFHIDYGDVTDNTLRQCILALAFVIDLRYFEDS